MSAALGTLINFPPGSDLLTFLGAVLGNNVEVSNSFAIDPFTNRLWVAATAPDAADGGRPLQRAPVEEESHRPAAPAACMRRPRRATTSSQRKWADT